MKRWMMSFMIFAWCALLAYSQAIAAEAQQPAVQAAPKALVSKKKVPGPVKKTWEDKLPEADPVEAEIEGTEKTLEGMVSGAGYNGLAVELSNPKKNEPSEIWFNYVKGIKLSGIQRLAELQEGDRVSVGYKEAKDSRRFLKQIKLIRKKPAEEIPPEEETSEE